MIRVCYRGKTQEALCEGRAGRYCGPVRVYYPRHFMENPKMLQNAERGFLTPPLPPIPPPPSAPAHAAAVRVLN